MGVSGCCLVLAFLIASRMGMRGSCKDQLDWGENDAFDFGLVY